MKKLLLCLFFLTGWDAFSQQAPIIEAWMLNTNGSLNEYWENTSGNTTNPTYVHYNSSDSANILSICYTNDSVWIRTNGLPDSSGQHKNPGAPTAQNWTFRFPKNPQIATTNISCPNTSVIGVLINGVAIYGKGDASSWSGNTQTNETMGQGLWNVDAWYGEGFTLDNAYGAHPAQAGDYHTHATPKLLYEFPSSAHSPIVGFAMDGYPIYGPYAYTNPMDVNSGVSRMESSYALRNITQRHVLPNGTMLAPPDWGPDVSTTHPLSEYGEDYEYVSGSGDLDEFNGRFGITPEYPNGTYAYFVTTDSIGDPAYPYFIGTEYYGTPDTANFYGGAYDIKIPPTGTSCVGTTAIFEFKEANTFSISPNPATNTFFVQTYSTSNADYTLIISDKLGRIIQTSIVTSNNQEISLTNNIKSGLYFISLINDNNQTEEVQKLIIE